MELKIRGAFATTNTSEPILSADQTDLRQERSHSRPPIERVCLCGSSHHNLEPAFTLMNGKWKPHHETQRMVNEKIENGSVRLKQFELLNGFEKRHTIPKTITPRRNLRKKRPIRKITQ